jgi:CRISPR-associated protein Cas8b/Csh1 subtype I-B
MTTDSNTANDGEQAENDQTSTEARKEAFQAFLDDHAALSESPERRAVFSLGALIGHLSRYQDVSQTMADKYPVSNVTMMSLPRITAKTIDKTQVYSSQNQYDGVMFQEVLTELSDTMSHEKINDWELSLPDIKFHYSLGLAYGLGYRQGN